MKSKPNRLLPFIIQGRFYNRSHKKKPSFVWRSIYMLLISRMRRLLAPTTYDQWHAPGQVMQRSAEPRITWIGHASFLVQIGGVNLLLDPLFGAPSLLFNRLVPPGIPRDKLPPIDAVLLSHNHYDHMDAASLIHIKGAHTSSFLVPRGDAAWFERRGFHSVYEFDWWQHRVIDPAGGVRVTFLPAHHWSARGLLDINKSLWGSWMIEYQGYTIYFAGDTAWDEHFAQIKASFGSIDVALLPIGPCEPHKWMKSSHLNAEQAGEAARALGARHTVAMHWGTFGFGLDHFMLPVERIKNWWASHTAQLTGQTLHILKAGERFSEKISRE